MKFNEIPVVRFSIRVRPTDGSSFEKAFSGSRPSIPVVGVTPSASHNEFELALAESIVVIQPAVAPEAQRLNSELASGRAMLAQLSDIAPDGSVELSIAFFTGAPLEMGELEVGVDEYVEKGVKRIDKRAARDIYRWLEAECCFTVDAESYFFLTAGPAIEDFLAPGSEDVGPAGVPDDDEEGSDDKQALTPREGPPQVGQTVKNSFCVTGNNMRLTATSTTLPEGKSIYVATRLTELKGDSDRAVRLAKGKLKFVDWTQAGQIQLLSKAQLANLTQDKSSYLRKWDEFGDLEGELLLREARQIGVLDYTSPTQNRDGTVTVMISDASDQAFHALKSGGVDEVEAVTTSPEYLTNQELSFSDFSSGMAAEHGAAARGTRRRGREKGRYLKVIRFDDETRSLTLDTESLTATGSLVLSLQGEITQIRRRQSARRAILEGRSANPQLGLLIEEKGEITSSRSPQKVRPLTAFVREKVFTNPPTLMQEKAIEVALNTPDIALIQGPPGTGKTTVIAAILERLNERAAQSGGDLKGRVLLSGFQHDAVENMIDRISLNGIPVPKFGQRSGSGDDVVNSFEMHLETWCKTIADDLRRKNPHLADLEEEAEIKDLYVQYLQMPSHGMATRLVARIAATDAAVLGETLSRTAARLERRLSTEELLTYEDSPYIQCARRLRVRQESFADDGPERAEDALEDLAEVLEGPEVTLLDKASLWRSEKGSPPFLTELAALKRTLLTRLTAPPEFRVAKQSDEVLTLGDDALRRIRERGHTASDRKTAALAQFLIELENNPYGIVDAVSDFSYAFAATVQQSVNEKMQARKGISAGDDTQSLEYDYVIIDEAARVSPRDLMIPMAQGKRIILVGDHRQLPHIIDEEVARSMDAGEAGPDERDWLKKSMFQYLFAERLKALEDSDGIARRVTLDKQFRMHPKLGDFVGRNFYERFDHHERFTTGLPEQAFEHHLSGTDNKAAIWLDVQTEAGPGRRSGTSWTRQAEADRITRQLKEWIGSEEGKNLTYGVISFYKAQADLIRTQLRTQLGELADDVRKIRVGTVDSFQGMEFDVVFLSVVRTIPPSWTPRDLDPAVQARGLFGHLCLYNRLNVSMSRQKKLLVLVGDSALVRHDLAKEFIPGLVDFYGLSHSSAWSPGMPGLGATQPSAAKSDPGAPTQGAPGAGVDGPRPNVFARLFGRGQR